MLVPHIIKAWMVAAEVQMELGAHIGLAAGKDGHDNVLVYVTAIDFVKTVVPLNIMLSL